MMASNIDNSYYMGMNYRPIYRPSQQKKQIKRKFINPFETKETKKDEEEKKNIIHVNKNRKRIQQILKYQNPFLKRKQSEQQIKKKRSGKSQGPIENSDSTQYLKVTKINRLKTEGNADSEIVLIDPITIPVQKIALPTQKKRTQAKQQNYTHQRLYSQKDDYQRQLIINIQKQSVFNHFPSQLFISPVSNTKLSFKKKKQNPTRNYSYFFPSNRSKTEVQKTKWKKVKNMTRPNSCVPRRKDSKQKRVFNFDGTLQNHQIIIPQRPKTADGVKKQRKSKRNIQYYDYESIAKKCIKLKKERIAQQIEKGLKLLPWSNQQRFSPDAFQLSYSTIRGQFLQM